MKGMERGVRLCVCVRECVLGADSIKPASRSDPPPPQVRSPCFPSSDHDHLAGPEEHRAEAGAEEPIAEEPPGASGHAQQPPQAPPRAPTSQVSPPLPPFFLFFLFFFLIKEQKWLRLDKQTKRRTK